MLFGHSDVLRSCLLCAAPELQQVPSLQALRCLAGLRRIRHDIIVLQTLPDLNRLLQTPCTASARKSMTGVGKSSWSCPRCWRASLWPTHWSSRPRSRSSGQHKGTHGIVLVPLSWHGVPSARVSLHPLLGFYCTASPGRQLCLYSESIVDHLACARVPQPDKGKAGSACPKGFGLPVS